MPFIFFLSPSASPRLKNPAYMKSFDDTHYQLQPAECQKMQELIKHTDQMATSIHELRRLLEKDNKAKKLLNEIEKSLGNAAESIYSHQESMLPQDVNELMSKWRDLKQNTLQQHNRFGEAIYIINDLLMSAIAFAGVGIGCFMLAVPPVGMGLLALIAASSLLIIGGSIMLGLYGYSAHANIRYAMEHQMTEIDEAFGFITTYQKNEEPTNTPADPSN